MFDLRGLAGLFHELYGREPHIFSAPGRINLIGEHTDYNEGFVLPLAANRRTWVAAAKREDGVVRVYSSNLEERREFNLKRVASDKGWHSYVEGIARILWQQGVKLEGADIAIQSEVPIGSGLSSSAALEISVGFALLSLAGAPIDLMELTLAAQTAEHEFIGTKSGLMDQLAACFAQKDHAMLIDCRSFARTQIPINVPSTTIVVCDTRIKHELASSAYNLRRQECESAVQILRGTDSSIRSLRDVTIEDLDRHGELLPQNILRRCRHVITENDRTLEAAEALRIGDVSRLGVLMNESHESLRNDYEVSCPELDLMVTLAREQEGVTGARMMGGGFGGSTVNLVRRDYLEKFRHSVSTGYSRASGLDPAIFAIEADDGVSELHL